MVMIRLNLLTPRIFTLPAIQFTLSFPLIISCFNRKRVSYSFRSKQYHFTTKFVKPQQRNCKKCPSTSLFYTIISIFQFIIHLISIASLIRQSSSICLIFGYLGYICPLKKDLFPPTIPRYPRKRRVCYERIKYAKETRN